ncbi:MAG: nucleotide sugar dehydrogenase [Candidatus Saganbacteria bacterium]|nr:nucleotide sugar dehydrogenase [Candidatus Saganbacteria bacterium]
MKFKYKACVVGGCGHVGLPLAITLADAGLNTAILDINEKAVKTINSGIVPFKEIGAEEKLIKVLKNKKLTTSTNNSIISESEYVVIIIGTPIDRHLNPKIEDIHKVTRQIIPFIKNGQTIILRSTVYPGTSRMIAELLRKNNKKVKLAFCPERIAQGYAIEEIKSLPQIIGGIDKASEKSAIKLFSKIADETIVISLEEAELAKLFTNAWRYIQFATANQFFMIADQKGLDFHKILHAIKHNYPRAKNFPGAGLAAGPCLFKDTMQIAAFNNNQFFLGHAAMLINEGFPDYIITKLKAKYDLKKSRVGILGMSFKADNDDKRDSLAYKLKKVLEIEAREVLCTDVYIKEPGFVNPKTLIKNSDIIIVATPHKEYKKLRFKTKQKIVDIWNFYKKGGTI